MVIITVEAGRRKQHRYNRVNMHVSTRPLLGLAHVPTALCRNRPRMIRRRSSPFEVQVRRSRCVPLRSAAGVLRDAAGVHPDAVHRGGHAAGVASGPQAAAMGDPECVPAAAAGPCLPPRPRHRASRPQARQRAHGPGGGA
eukprot:1176335-Prorocentrum_minimum.AAC.3